MNICFWMPVLTQATSRKIDLTQASGVATPTSTDYINFPLQTSLQESNLELDPTDQLRGGKQTLPLSFWFSYRTQIPWRGNVFRAGVRSNLLASGYNETELVIQMLSLCCINSAPPIPLYLIQVKAASLGVLQKSSANYITEEGQRSDLTKVTTIIFGFMSSIRVELTWIQ